jgi:hypothetical protein
MPDIRDSIKRAVDRTLQELQNKPQPVQKSFSGSNGPQQKSDVHALLERAQQKLADIKDEDVINEHFVHTDDADVALLLSALEQATPLAKGEIAGVHKYDTTDPNWILSALNMVVRPKVPYIEWTSLDDFRVAMPEGNVSVAIAGDWGTGLFTSNQIALQMAAQKPEITLHIGDVYYSGTPSEVFTKFLTHFPHGSFGSFAMNSNHEMYAGGEGYFNATLRDPNFAAHQKASYFCLYNSKWQLIALDSAYDSDGGVHLYQHGNLRATQIQWLMHQLQIGHQTGRRNVILSHHNPISIDGELDLPFFDQVITAAQGNPFDYWYWGHEHDGAVFAPYTRGGITFRGRCIGHGGIPYSPETIGAKQNGAVVEWTEQEKYVPPAGDPRAALNGFATITLPADGSDIREIFYDDRGQQRWPATAAAKAVVAANVATALAGGAGAATMPDKVLVTNRARLIAKYGDVTAIDAAVQALVAADAARHLATRVIALDDAAHMASLQASPVTDATSPQQNKEAIDAIFTAITPDYLVIVGGPDVIPHQDLMNPMSDDDALVYSDLPYACEAPYSQAIENFTGPTRVVGRIPDLPGATEPSLLIRGLETATSWKSRPVGDYAKAFGLSAVEWQQSTDLSLKNVFGAGATLVLSPPSMTQTYTAMELEPLAHFINCHGAPHDRHFYGQEADVFPISHDSTVIHTLVTAGTRFDGTLVAAECCYGGELYPPADPADWAICTRYLEAGAYAYFGSTTTAYGPASGNGQADILCQRFMKKAISGASTGRAVLEARLDYINGVPEMSPQDLKTLAQFYLLGDPSITPATAPAAKSFLGANAMTASAGRAERRRHLAAQGELLSKHKPVARKKRPEEAMPAEVHAKLLELASQYDMDEHRMQSYAIDKRDATPGVASRFEAKSFGGAANAPSSFHIVIGRRRRKHTEDANAPKLPHIVAFVAKEAGGKVVSYTELHSK